MSLIIYRVQDKEGRGPFRPNFSKEWLDKKRPHDHILPAWPIQFPEVFFMITVFRRIYCGCGCTSKDQLKLWFSPFEMKRLKKFGYRCVTFEAEEIFERSDVQCVFRRLKPLRDDVIEFELYARGEIEELTERVSKA